MSSAEYENGEPTDERIGFVFDCDFFLRGFVQVPGYIILDPDLNDAAFRTLLVIMQHAWREGECYPGLQRLADMRGKGRRAVMRHIQELEESGHLTKHRRGRGKTNLYIINTQRRVVDLRSDKNGTCRSDIFDTRSISSIISSTDLFHKSTTDGVGADGQARPVSYSSIPKGERIKRVINSFRDRHLKAGGVKYMVREPQDRVLATALIKTYTDEQIEALLALYFQAARGGVYSFGGFHKRVPELLQDYAVACEDIKADTVRQIEFEMVERMIANWDEAMIERREWIESLEGRIDELTKTQPIPDEDMRGRLKALISDLSSAYKSALTILCKTLGVPLVLKHELHRLLDGDYLEVRACLVRMRDSRSNEGGEKI